MALIRQGSWFLVIGVILVAVDWAVFVALSALGMAVIPANVFGRVAGACLGFWLNGRLTFAGTGQARLGRLRFSRFVLAWLVLTLLSTFLISFAASQLTLAWVWLAKPMIEVGLSVVSFFIARHWVYR